MVPFPNQKFNSPEQTSANIDIINSDTQQSTRNQPPSIITNENPIDHLEASTSVLTSLNLIPPRIPAEQSILKRPSTGFDHHHLASYPNWPARSQQQQQQLATQQKTNYQINNDIDIATNRIIVNAYQQQVSQQQQQQLASSNNNSPLIFTLVGLSSLVFIALIVVATLGSSSTTSFKRGPIDK